MTHALTPRRGRIAPPLSGEERCHGRSARFEHRPKGTAGFGRTMRWRDAKPQGGAERDRNAIENGPRAAGRPHVDGHRRVPCADPPVRVGRARMARRIDRAGDRVVRKKGSGQSRNHARLRLVTRRIAERHSAGVRRDADRSVSSRRSASSSNADDTRMRAALARSIR